MYLMYLGYIFKFECRTLSCDISSDGVETRKEYKKYSFATTH